MKKTVKFLLPFMFLLILYAIHTSSVLEAPAPITILMYHHLVADGEEINSVTVTESKFRQDMEYLRKNHYTTLLPEDLLEILNGNRKCPRRAVVISFDDGYHSNYSIAYPILRQNRCRAVIALLTANIHKLNEGNPFFLSWPEIEQMSASGWIDFGSHSDNLHNPDNKGMARTDANAVNGVQRIQGETEEEYQQRVGTDIRRSCTLIEAHTGKPVLWFAYPYGAGDSWCEYILNDLNIPFSVTTNPGNICVGTNLRGLPRCAVREDTDLSELLSSQNQ